jgi:hypothetical protein
VAVGSKVGTVTAVDEDIGENGMIDYLITCKSLSVDIGFGEKGCYYLLPFSTHCMQFTFTMYSHVPCKSWRSPFKNLHYLDLITLLCFIILIKVRA